MRSGIELDTGMLLTLRVNFGKRFEANTPDQRNIVPFRMWLGRGILITARGRASDEGEMRMPSLSRTLENGCGPATCGALASAVISEITSITAESVETLEDDIFALKAGLQQHALQAGAHRPVASAALQEVRRELMPLRYAAISMRRYEVPELNALQTVVRLTERPEQTLFTDADKYELREAKARQVCDIGLSVELNGQCRSRSSKPSLVAAGRTPSRASILTLPSYSLAFPTLPYLHLTYLALP